MVKITSLSLLPAIGMVQFADLQARSSHRHRHTVAHDPDAVADAGAHRAQPEGAALYAG